MRSKIFYPVILFAGFIFVNLTVNQAYSQTPQDKPVKQEVVKYTCPMHAEVVQDKPGNCPKCGMKLVEKKGMKKDGMKKEGMKKDTSMMKHDHKKMMHDSASMKNGDMKM